MRELSGAQTAPWLDLWLCVRRTTLLGGRMDIMNSSPCSTKETCFSSRSTANSVALLVNVSMRSVLDLSSVWTSMASLRGCEPSFVQTSQRSAPHSYTIQPPLALMRALRTLSSVWKVTCTGLTFLSPGEVLAGCLTMLELPKYS